MKSFHTSESRASDELLNGSLSESDADDAVLSDEALRLARIDEYGHEALHSDDPEVANFGAITGGIFRLIQHYEKATFKLLGETRSDSHDSPELDRAVSILLNLTRQAERNANLITRLNNARQQGEYINSQRRQSAVPGAVAHPSRRKGR